MTAPTLSVCVCTYNRAASLRLALETLANQHDPGMEWELIVVDNNCSDGTQAVLREAAQHLPLRHVRESRQGLSHARNRALVETRGEVLVFTDDDVRLAPDWLLAYAEAVQAAPTAEFFGGRIKPDWQGRPPAWVRHEPMDLLDGLLVHYDLGDGNRDYRDSDPLPFGASFGLRRRLFERLGPFCAHLGVRGDVPGRSEETEYLGRARAIGARGVYVGKSLCWHIVDRARLRLSYLYRFGYQKGLAEARMRPGRQPRGSSMKAGLFLLRGVYQLVKRRGDRFRQCVINAGIQTGLRDAGSGAEGRT